MESLSRLEHVIASTEDVREKIDALNDLAWQLDVTDIERGLAISQEAGVLATTGAFEQEPYLKGEADSLRNLGRFYQRKGQYKQSLAVCNQAYDLYEALDDVDGMLQALSLIGSTYYELHEYPEALSYTLRGLDLFEETQNLVGAGSIYNTAGDIYSNLGDFEKGIPMYQKALEINRQIGHKNREGAVLNNMAVAYYSIEAWDEALDAAEKSLAIAVEHNMDLLEAVVLGTLGEIYLYQGKYEQARERLKQGIDKSHVTGYSRTEIYGLYYMGVSYRQQARFDEATECFERVVELAQGGVEKQVAYQAYEALADIAKRNHDYERALRYYEKYHEAEKAVFSENTQIEIKRLEFHHYSISEERERIREAEYRILFEESPIALFDFDASEVKQYIDGLQASGIGDIRAYFLENPDEVQTCFGLLRVKNVNQAAVEMFEAETKEDFLKGFKVYVDDEAIQMMGQILADFAEGQVRSTGQYQSRTLRGRRLYLETSNTLPLGTAEDWSRLISSAVDITDQKELEKQLRAMSTTDVLTRISNRRHFFEVARNAFDRACEEKRNLLVILFDVDHFKQINDTYGHMTGDFVLQQVAQLCQGLIRESDLIARYGGEEFAVLMERASLEAGEKLAERLRTQIEAAVFEYEGQEMKSTISVGVAMIDQRCDDNLDELIEKADMALYYSKENGRNQTTVWKESLEVIP